MAKDVGIDLGTANVLIHVKGRGIVVNEPAVVAINNKTGEVLAVGTEARDMVGRTPGDITAIKPMKDGVIADFDIVQEMLRFFIQKLNLRTFFSRPRILICCPTNITSVEQKAIREVAEKSGGKQVFLEEEPKVAAIGAGMEIFEPSGNMIIDIGGGTADVAVLSMGDIVTSQSVKVAGNRWDSDILNYIKRKYNLLIGERTAENIKITIGTANPGSKEETMDIRGRDLVSGLPKTISISSSEVEEAIHDSLHLMVLSAKQVLEQTPPELSADIIDRGVIMTGGGSLLHGLDDLMAEQLKVPVLITENPLDVVALGTGILLDSLTAKKRGWF
ncbi:rod shape-determining protein MreB [Listeria ivanovii]|uniref:Cell shape-determining protein MreB n=1 Tax=Listeria ivanovii (strain ATCC BAA-678 / PAM 55) TaxID=881621 RepID=G2ZFG2_LISIP|nr:rod shape-determining protein MreB [Listeria ivanovii]AHI56950.1 rod shape-determining protein MreB [Listeria ivanovii WSLC3009]AIS66366.1 rod shape-determining protein MreB [Listeria ivanovii subsp. ivanovii]MBC1759832.1 rod shape-determining protein MreB [Listeria ivanovii]MBK3915079.1 rod shape-determining protein MreB [Listeria ivanovii subsp. ivanovii]MBK3922297.1 rod shape-determining protein MreB [Listeria ivanovii subsp. ivanovii]